MIFSTAEFKLAELLSIVSTVVSVLSLVVSTDVLVSVVLLSFFVEYLQKCRNIAILNEKEYTNLIGGDSFDL